MQRDGNLSRVNVREWPTKINRRFCQLGLALSLLVRLIFKFLTSYYQIFIPSPKFNDAGSWCPTSDRSAACIVDSIGKHLLLCWEAINILTVEYHLTKCLSLKFVFKLNKNSNWQRYLGCCCLNNSWCLNPEVSSPVCLNSWAFFKQLIRLVLKENVRRCWSWHNRGWIFYW